MMTIKEILKLDSGLYTADVDGKPAVIGRDKGKGFTIRTECKPGWDMINHYDEDGDYEGATFEAQHKRRTASKCKSHNQRRVLYR